MSSTSSNISPLGKCFVIMPFSRTTKAHDTRYWTTFFKNYLAITVKELGYECIRSKAGPNNIVKGIVKGLHASDVVLAILTDFNPNVLYELGIRQSIAHGTIMAIEKGQKIPFDIAPFGVIHYERNNRKAFKENLAHYLGVVRKKDQLDSPVAEYFLQSPIRIVQMASNVADTHFSNQHILATAKKSIFIVGQNLYSLAKDDNSKDNILNALQSRPDLLVRIMVVDPKEKHLVPALSSIIDESLGPNLDESIKCFRSWRSNWLLTNPSDLSRFEVRLSSRIGNVSATFADADTEAGQMLLRPIFYHTRPKERPCYLLSRRDTREAFDIYYRNLDQEWTHARKLV